MDEKIPSLIYLSPVTPRTKGHGASMRAGLNLEAISANFNVHLVIISNTDTTELLLEPAIEQCCTSVTHVQMSTIQALPINTNRALFKEYFTSKARILREYPPHLAHVIHEKVPVKAPPAAIHCFRLALIDIAYTLSSLYQIPNKQICLDLDDYESRTAKRNAQLERRRLGRLRHALSLKESSKIFKAEDSASKRCGAILLCSEEDKMIFQKEHPSAKVFVVPNGYRLSEPLATPTGSRPTLVFVGTLSYQPNTDALTYFVGDIWPILVKKMHGEVELIVAGRTPPQNVIRLCQQPGIRLLANLPEVETAYYPAHLLIVPLRTGGGTRIKILEAINFGRPVVSTSIGAEGLKLQHDSHILLADTVQSFVLACEKLLRNEKEAKRLVESARRQVASLYSPAAISRQLKLAYASLSEYTDR